MWLAQKFQQQKAKNADITVASFALSHGIQPKLLRRFIPHEPTNHRRSTASITLWHGTTADRANTILKSGFSTLGRKNKGLWFTLDKREAHGIAGSRATARRVPPVVFRCMIDLNRYSNFGRPNARHYVFWHETIDKTVIRNFHTDEAVEREFIETKSRAKKTAKAKVKSKSVGVTVTNTSGKYGVLFWINAYLEMQAKPSIDDNHSAVDTVWEWVETQYDNGREEPISDEEMTAQVGKALLIRTKKAEIEP